MEQNTPSDVHSTPRNYQPTRVHVQYQVTDQDRVVAQDRVYVQYRVAAPNQVIAQYLSRTKSLLGSKRTPGVKGPGRNVL